ncbi:acyl-CoA dehydrogenase family protein [Pseudocitrobacter faecalis]
MSEENDTQRIPRAHLIQSDDEAIAIAHEIAAYLQTGASERDQTGIVPPEVVDTFSNSGLWGITVPRRWGGAEVSAVTLAKVIAIISAADPRWGRFPRIITVCWKTFVCRERRSAAILFSLVLQGYRFANALSETGGKTVQDIQTRLTRTPEGLRINGRKGYCTGSLYAHWLGVLALDEEGLTQLAFVPRNTPV